MPELHPLLLLQTDALGVTVVVIEPLWLAQKLLVTLLVPDSDPQTLEVAQALEVPETVAHRVAEAHTVTVADTEGQRDGSGETVPQPVEEAERDGEPLGDTVGEIEAIALAQ